MAGKSVTRAVTIWHNPKCGTSRKVLEMIRAKGIEPTIVDYVKTPPSVADIKSALKQMGAKPRDLLRRREELEPLLRRHGVRLRTEVLQDEGRELWPGVALSSPSAPPLPPPSARPRPDRRSTR